MVTHIKLFIARKRPDKELLRFIYENIDDFNKMQLKFRIHILDSNVSRSIKAELEKRSITVLPSMVSTNKVTSGTKNIISVLNNNLKTFRAQAYVGGSLMQRGSGRSGLIGEMHVQGQRGTPMSGAPVGSYERYLDENIGNPKDDVGERSLSDDVSKESIDRKMEQQRRIRDAIYKRAGDNSQHDNNEAETEYDARRPQRNAPRPPPPVTRFRDNIRGSTDDISMDRQMENLIGTDASISMPIHGADHEMQRILDRGGAPITSGIPVMSGYDG